MKLSDIALIVDGNLSANEDVEITGLAKIDEASTGDLTFLSNLKYAKYFASTQASAIMISNSIDIDSLPKRDQNIAIIFVPDAYSSFMLLVDRFYPEVNVLPKGIDPTAIIHPDAVIGTDIAIGPGVVISEKCRIGNRTVLHANVVLYPYVEIGDDSLLYANVVVREQCRIGNNVIIHSGTVVGSDGFGFLPQEDGKYKKVPQRGIVVIQDDVEIGANCTIDRATLGETRIERGVKLDNLIQVAHNVVIGADTVIAAQSGISGSTKIGKNCVLAGQVGIVGHITIADRTTVGAQSGISKSITETGKTFFGYPAKEHKQALRIEGSLRQLPEALVELRNLRQRLEAIEQQLNDNKVTNK